MKHRQKPVPQKRKDEVRRASCRLLRRLDIAPIRQKIEAIEDERVRAICLSEIDDIIAFAKLRETC